MTYPLRTSTRSRIEDCAVLADVSKVVDSRRPFVCGWSSALSLSRFRFAERLSVDRTLFGAGGLMMPFGVAIIECATLATLAGQKVFGRVSSRVAFAMVKGVVVSLPSGDPRASKLATKFCTTTDWKRLQI